MREGGLSCIFEVDKILSQKSCVFFVDFGTLLGFVRNGKPLSWDYDIDFGICIDDQFQWDDLYKAMTENGFQLARQFSFQNVITEQTYRKNNVFVDFFNHFTDSNNSYYYIYYKEQDYNYKDENSLHARMTKTIRITGSQKIAVEGGYVHVPNEYESYLADVYGEDWRVPNPNWNADHMTNITKMNDFGIMEEF